MSRIGKKSIKIPSGTEVKIDGQLVSVKGAKGTQEYTFDQHVQIKVEDSLVWVTVDNNDKTLWGLSRALLNNMIQGTSKGFEKILEFTGVGFKAQVKGSDLELNLGFSNPITVKAPEGVTFIVEKNTIKIAGVNRTEVGQTAALVRKARPPEPYKGTGIKYKDEIIRRKAGKKAVAGAA